VNLDEIVFSLDDTQLAAVIDNLDTIRRWEQQLFRRGDDPQTHRITAKLMQSLIDTLTPDPETDGSWIEVKTINGKQYEYKRWREDGKLKSKYLRKVPD